MTLCYVLHIFSVLYAIHGAITIYYYYVLSTELFVLDLIKKNIY